MLIEWAKHREVSAKPHFPKPERAQMQHAIKRLEAALFHLHRARISYVGNTLKRLGGIYNRDGRLALATLTRIKFSGANVSKERGLPSKRVETGSGYMGGEYAIIRSEKRLFEADTSRYFPLFYCEVISWPSENFLSSPWLDLEFLCSSPPFLVCSQVFSPTLAGLISQEYKFGRRAHFLHCRMQFSR